VEIEETTHHILVNIQAPLAGLRSEMGELRSELRADMGSLRSEVRAEIGALRDELRRRIDQSNRQLLITEARLSTDISALRAHILEFEAKYHHGDA